MRDITVSDYKVKNKFPAIQVMGIMRAPFRGDDHDLIDFYDTKNGKLVLSVGTENISDYYPGWVAVFDPRNMSTNDGAS